MKEATLMKILCTFICLLLVGCSRKSNGDLVIQPASNDELRPNQKVRQRIFIECLANAPAGPQRTTF